MTLLFRISYIYILLWNTLTSNGLVEDYNNHRNEINIAEDDIGSFPFLMPSVSPKTPDLYLCTPIKVDPTTSYYIVGYRPNATMNTAHHMLLYGCGEPGTTKMTWNCGEMAKSTEEETASPCGPHSHSQILYAWARDAPKLDLPPGVGFKVGKDSPTKYLVLQVHYAHVDKFKSGGTDDSGIFLHYTERPPTGEDEMCNFYLMYYVDGAEPLNMKYCFSQGAPNYYWSNPDSGLHNIPHIEASTL
ncbi:Phm [Drosophila busckii]|uniref:peptidylglycine monooxygenase n=1 Tax=Drosophila busckii TaxID=30019 RepID=A0A0M4ELW2_DROBS|nr:Phm [Drosophila busckii]